MLDANVPYSQLMRITPTTSRCRGRAQQRAAWLFSAMGAAHQVAAAMGWSLPYTLGVLWPLENGGAKDLATKQLAQLAARKAAKKAAEAAAPSTAKPKPPTDRVRATPLRRRT